MTRPEWVEAGARAYAHHLGSELDPSSGAWDKGVAAAVIAAVEPLIRADEIKRMENRGLVCAYDLRAQIADAIEALALNVSGRSESTVAYMSAVEHAAGIVRGES